VPYPLNFDFAPDAYVLKWMLAVALATGVVFGLAPALLASRTDLVGVIKGDASAPSGGRRWNPRGALVVAQITISLVVLICAGLFVRSLGNAHRTDPGFRVDDLVTMMINLDLLGYDREAAWRFYPELQRRVEAQPGVRTAALASELPLMDSRGSRGPIVREGEIDPPPNHGETSECSLVTPRYFDTLRTPLVRGRDFTDRDDAGAPPVVIVNQEFARRFYGGEAEAMGKRFRFAEGTPLMEIVGVAKDGRYGTLYEDPQPYMFLPVYQHHRARMTLLVSARSAGEVPAIVEGARDEIARMDPRLPVFGVIVGDENLTLAYMGPRVAAGVATTFGVLALVLATVGLYSVMAYAVSQRTREIGIRMALGACVRDVLRMVVGQGMRMVLAGVALGTAGAFALTRALSSLLLGVGATDAVTFVGVSALLVAVALLACYVPARRAARVDPLVALRHE
jgi:predicted permease